MRDLILLGGGQSRGECPYDAEVWAASSVILLPDIRVESVSRVFAFDLYQFAKGGIQVAKKHNIPIVSTRNYATENYPLKEITEEFRTKLFRNSISYMIAYAIYKGYEKLRLYGIDQGPEWEYIATRPYVMYWLGVANGRGIEFEMADHSLLFDPQISAIQKQLNASMEEVTLWLLKNKDRLTGLS